MRFILKFLFLALLIAAGLYAAATAGFNPANAADIPTFAAGIAVLLVYGLFAAWLFRPRKSKTAIEESLDAINRRLDDISSGVIANRVLEQLQPQISEALSHSNPRQALAMLMGHLPAIRSFDSEIADKLPQIAAFAKAFSDTRWPNLSTINVDAVAKLPALLENLQRLDNLDPATLNQFAKTLASIEPLLAEVERLALDTDGREYRDFDELNATVTGVLTVVESAKQLADFDSALTGKVESLESLVTSLENIGVDGDGDERDFDSLAGTITSLRTIVDAAKGLETFDVELTDKVDSIKSLIDSLYDALFVDGDPNEGQRDFDNIKKALNALNEVIEATRKHFTRAA